MTPRASFVAWSLWAFALALAVAGLVFLALGIGTPLPGSSEPRLRAIEGLVAVVTASFATVGALIASRRPENPIGWIFCGAGIAFGVAQLAYWYAAYTLFVRPGSLPGGDVAAWVTVWLFLPALFLAGFLLLLLFPDGRLPSRRWRPVVVLAVLGVTMLAVGLAFAPGTFDDDPFTHIENPFGIERAGGALDNLGFGFLPYLLGFVAAGVALVRRFRRSTGDERAQLKWATFAGSLTTAGLVAISFVSWNSGEAVQAAVSGFLFLSITGIAVSTGFAILKYRLYDIDLIIRRTLVYGVLTAGLAGLYFGIVLALQELFASFAGGSDLAIAVSTLVVAALFRPARRRVQSAVDRRFYRSRYDAQRTLEAFSARLRDEIDLDALAAELGRVVRETLRPAHLSLWLRAPEGRL